MKPLNRSFYISAAIAIALNFAFTKLFMGDSPLAYALFGTTVVGVILVPVIQKITDRYTNYKYGPVKEISESAKWGYASLTLMGIIKGLQSTGPFMIALVTAIIISYALASSAAPEILLYPILIATSGMIASIIGTATIGSKNVKDVMKPLNRSFYISAAIAIALNFAFTKLFMGDSPLAYALFGTTVVGVILVPVIQKITDRYTNYKYGPVKEISESTKLPVLDLVLQMMQARMRL